MKAIEFLGDSLACLRAFPAPIRRDMGFQLDRVQRNLKPTDFKPMKSVGHGVEEIRSRDSTGTYRVIYVASLGNTGYVLHAFQKKSRKTSKTDRELARGRLADVLRRLR